MTPAWIFAIPFLLWAFFFIAHMGNMFEMEATRVPFVQMFDRYCFVFARVFYISAAATVLSLYFHLPLAPYAFAGATVCSILFQGWSLFCYEYTLHGGTYRATRYALTLSLGWSTAIFFVLGTVSAVVAWR